MPAELCLLFSRSLKVCNKCVVGALLRTRGSIRAFVSDKVRALTAACPVMKAAGGQDIAYCIDMPGARG